MRSGVGGGARGLPRLAAAAEAEIGIAPTLTAAGVKRESIPRLVEIAIADICHQTNPQPVTAADFERLFEEAM